MTTGCLFGFLAHNLAVVVVNDHLQVILVSIALERLESMEVVLEIASLLQSISTNLATRIVRIAWRISCED